MTLYSFHIKFLFLSSKLCMEVCIYNCSCFLFPVKGATGRPGQITSERLVPCDNLPPFADPQAGTKGLQETPQSCQARSHGVLERNSEPTTGHLSSGVFMGLRSGRVGDQPRMRLLNDEDHSADPCCSGNGDRPLCQPECACVHTGLKIVMTRGKRGRKRIYFVCNTLFSLKRRHIQA